MKTADTSREHSVLKWAVIAGLGVILLWLLGWWATTHLYPSLTERGPFGDSFGALNALFSGLAFAGVIVAILLQREELRLQRRELQETRMELKRQADTAELSRGVMDAQRQAQLLSASVGALIELTRQAQEGTGDNNPDIADSCADLQARRVHGLERLFAKAMQELNIPKDRLAGFGVDSDYWDISSPMAPD